MKAIIRRSSLSGSLQAPPSKSYTHRAMFCAALARAESKLRSPLVCDDTLATSEALSELGVTTEWNGETSCAIRSEVLKKPEGVILCRESGTTLRFITSICATAPFESEISGGPSLLKRPVKDLAFAIQELGARCATDRGYPPVNVRGPMRGGSVKVPGNVSSQYVSALLLAAPLAQTPIEISILGRLESKSYVEMTLNMQSRFGVRVDTAEDLSKFCISGGSYDPALVQIEGDWSSATFLLAGTAMAGRKVQILGLDKESLQADRYLLQILARMSAHVNQDSDSVTVEKAELMPVEVDVSDCPDLFPAVCALSAVTDGVSKITGIRRLRMKESNRVLAMSLGLKELGVRTVESEDSLVIHGGRPRKAILNPHHDHRIAMAFALLGLCTNELTIIDAECVSKSYPSFWSDLQSLGAEVIVD